MGGRLDGPVALTPPLLIRHQTIGLTRNIPQISYTYHGHLEKKDCNGKREALTTRQPEPSTQTNPQDSDSSSSQEESDITVVPTDTTPIRADAYKASNANTTCHPDQASQTATPTASQPSNSEDTQQKTTSNIWAHFHQSGKGETPKATCKYCKKPLSAKSTSGMNHLWQYF
ncbi:hypothetical protein PSTG_09807 [Puccinia striiformis f. sp. tritici PST-78]|uniref:BED-type domain-containing protein n=1 Tax=Puccinia striiformis f. sp. tritici PST-78 TaxID=1165861 RepID=A0A0L0VCD4_9BASI|nr:hypothetical protein PSTG_09807 [Puccinia striiformis f. sp. tritici PST-78]